MLFYLNWHVEDMDEKKIFISYPHAHLIRYNAHDISQLEISKWCEQNIDYPIEFGYTNGRIVGIFLKPEDALVYKLTTRNNI